MYPQPYNDLAPQPTLTFNISPQPVPSTYTLNLPSTYTLNLYPQPTLNPRVRNVERYHATRNTFNQVLP